MLRDRDDAILSDMTGTCFVCGASKQSIEATSESFERHVKGSHNVGAACTLHTRTRTRDDEGGPCEVAWPFNGSCL
jgi:hypothetical protein